MTSTKKTSLEQELKTELYGQGAAFICFVDISHLSEKQNRGYSNAILFGLPLSPGFIQKLTRMPGYVQEMIRSNQIEEDEFHQKECRTDKMADVIADYIRTKGHNASSQSEKNICATGFYHEASKSTPLPHKTVAGMAGLGWIGKHNLLVTEKFGSAVSMCTVLTDAPLKTVLHSPLKSQCGDCDICKQVCAVHAIRGNSWSIRTTRDNLIDVNKCNTCLQCMIFCPWTQKYMKNRMETVRTGGNRFRDAD